jgi:cysteine-S-conjugate beta-lyase
MPSFAAIADQITISELRARGSVKWTRGGPGVIGAFVAEMDFGVAPPIKAALLDVINRADFGYLSDHAAAELANTRARWQADRYGWDVDPAWIRPLPDVITGLRAAIIAPSWPRSSAAWRKPSPAAEPA